MASDPRVTITQTITGLNEFLASCDSASYAAALMGLEQDIGEHTQWLASLAESKQPVTMTDARKARETLIGALNAVRNADQTRTDNQKAALT
jgi:hypothetical protein